MRVDFYKIISENKRDCKNACIALIGGGGKTSLMRKLGNELSHLFPRVRLSSLTKSNYFINDNIALNDDLNMNEFDQDIRNPLFVMKSKITEQKLIGISESDLMKIYIASDVTIFECDGANKLPLKIHNKIDPIVPSFATHVIILVGADVVDTELSDRNVHRHNQFSDYWKVSNNHTLDVEFISKVVTSKKGYLSKVLHQPKLIYFVNKSDSHNEKAKLLAKHISRLSNNPTYYGSVQSNFYQQI